MDTQPAPTTTETPAPLKKYRVTYWAAPLHYATETIEAPSAKAAIDRAKLEWDQWDMEECGGAFGADYARAVEADPASEYDDELDGGEEAEEELNDDRAALVETKAEIGRLRAALARAVPWLGKMIADGGHLESVAPNDAIGALAQAEAALAAIHADQAPAATPETNAPDYDEGAWETVKRATGEA